jgi:hypothetical protein
MMLIKVARLWGGGDYGEADGHASHLHRRQGGIE